MPDVHGRPAAQHVKAAAGCNHAHVRVVTASDVHLSRKHTIEVLEQVLLSVKQDVANRPSPTDDTVSLCLHPVTVSLRRHYCVTKTLCFFKLFPATGAKEVQAAKFDGEARSHTPLPRHPCSVRVRRETQKSAYAYSGGAEQGGFCCRGRPAAVRCVYCTCAVMNSRDVLVLIGALRVHMDMLSVRPLRHPAPRLCVTLCTCTGCHHPVIFPCLRCWANSCVCEQRMRWRCRARRGSPVGGMNPRYAGVSRAGPVKGDARAL